MKYLLDSCTFLWLIAQPKELSQQVREILLKLENTLFLSSVSVWELSLKLARGRLELPGDPSRFFPAMREKYRVHTLPLGEADAVSVTKLPALHRDPFDRMLIAQALINDLVLLTPDEQFTKYPVKVFW